MNSIDRYHPSRNHYKDDTRNNSQRERYSSSTSHCEERRDRVHNVYRDLRDKPRERYENKPEQYKDNSQKFDRNSSEERVAKRERSESLTESSSKIRRTEEKTFSLMRGQEIEK